MGRPQPKGNRSQKTGGQGKKAVAKSGKSKTLRKTTNGGVSSEKPIKYTTTETTKNTYELYPNGRRKLTNTMTKTKSVQMPKKKPAAKRKTQVTQKAVFTQERKYTIPQACAPSFTQSNALVYR